jgi:hypothetical protein
MADDVARLGLSGEHHDVVIVEIKTNDACKLNGPWTESEKNNIHRILIAIGCIPENSIADVAADLYNRGISLHGDRRIRLISIGRGYNKELRQQMENVVQIT